MESNSAFLEFESFMTSTIASDLSQELSNIMFQELTRTDLNISKQQNSTDHILLKLSKVCTDLDILKNQISIETAPPRQQTPTPANHTATLNDSIKQLVQTYIDQKLSDHQTMHGPNLNASTNTIPNNFNHSTSSHQYQSSNLGNNIYKDRPIRRESPNVNTIPTNKSLNESISADHTNRSLNDQPSFWNHSGHQPNISSEPKIDNEKRPDGDPSTIFNDDAIAAQLPDSLKIYIQNQIQKQLIEFEQKRLPSLLTAFISAHQQANDEKIAQFEQRLPDLLNSLIYGGKPDKSPESTTKGQLKTDQHQIEDLKQERSGRRESQTPKQVRWVSPARSTQSTKSLQSSASSRAPSEVEADRNLDRDAEQLLQKLRQRLDEKARLVRQMEAKKEKEHVKLGVTVASKPVRYHKPTLASQLKKKAFYA